jgi:hypothetical protein
MTATITGDYSKYPASIREVFPCLAGEVCDLRQAWEVYSHLFMEEKDLTDAMAERLGGVLGMFQSMLQDEMFLSIARLTDRDSRMQANLSLWSLLAAIPDAHDAGFDQNVRSALDRVCAAAAGVRKHRHKRIAHFDLRVSLSSAILPVVTFKEIREVLEQIESFLNLFYWEFEKTTMLFDSLPARDITDAAEATTYKARAYDALEAEGTIPKLEWRRRATR